MVLFPGYGEIISRTPLLKILVFGNNLPVALLELVVCQESLEYGEKKY